MAQWIVPRIWEGETCFIIGGGPSLTQSDVDLLRGKHVIAVTQSGLDLARWAPVKYFGDCQFWRWNKVRYLKLEGFRVTLCSQCRDHPKMQFLKTKAAYGISDEPDRLCSRHSGHAAINLAYLLGTVKIVLLGFDMKKKGSQGNYHAKYKTQTDDKVYAERFLPALRSIVEPLRDAGVEVVNASRDTAIDFWPRAPLEKILGQEG
jgi:hypothetical protein